MPRTISRRTVLAAAAGLSSCNKLLPSAGEFLGAPHEVDRRWFGLYDAARFIADGRALRAKGSPSNDDIAKWRLRIGAFDVTGKETLSPNEGLSLGFADMIQVTAFGLGPDPMRTIQPGPNATYLIERALGDSIAVTPQEFSPDRKLAADYVNGKLYRDFAAWPQGAPSEGLMPAIDPASKLWGFTGADGQFRIRPQFKKAHSFSGGFARVGDAQDRIGLINPKGELTVPHKYQAMSKMIDGNCTFKDHQGVGIVNGAHRELRVNGADTVRFEGGDFAVATESNFFGGTTAVLISIKDGKLMHLSGKLATVFPTSRGAIVRVEGMKQCHLLGADGKILNDRRFTEAQQAYAGITKVTHDAKVGWIDGEGKWIVEPRYQFVSLFKFGWALFKKNENDSYGLVNRKGKEILEGQLFDGESLGRVIVAQKKLDKGRFQFVYYNTNGDKIRETEPVVPSDQIR